MIDDNWEMRDYKRLEIVKPSDKYWAVLTVAIVVLAFWFLKK